MNTKANERMNPLDSEMGRYLSVIFINVDKIRIGFKVDEKRGVMREIISHACAR